MQFSLLGNEATQVGLHGNIILVVIVETALRQALVNRTEAFGLLVEAHVDRSDVTHVERHRCLSRPTAFAVKVGHTQLVDPDHAALGRR